MTDEFGLEMLKIWQMKNTTLKIQLLLYYWNYTLYTHVRSIINWIIVFLFLFFNPE